MKLFTSCFELSPQNSLNSQSQKDLVEGLLFKLEKDDKASYASMVFHPALDAQDRSSFLNSINSKSFQESAVYLNLMTDLDLKENKKNLSELIIKDLDSHHTVRASFNDFKNLKKEIFEYKKYGFKRFKIKTGPSFFLNYKELIETLDLSDGCTFILDFNSSATFQNFLKIEWPVSFVEKIYLEDPIEFEFKSWKQLFEMGFKLIYDQKKTKHNTSDLKQICQIVSLKPTKENAIQVIKKFEGFKILVTTNMGDELDHLISAYWANLIFKTAPQNYFGCGLYTRNFFQPTDLINEKSRILEKNKSVFKTIVLPSENLGWSNSRLYEKLDWSEQRHFNEKV